jgi:hypothetical protein
VALKRSDVGNEALSVARPGKVLVVPPWAYKLVASMDDMSLRDSIKRRMMMIHLWDICDPDIVELHPNNAFEECLGILVDEYVNVLLAPAITKTMFWDNAPICIQQ